MKYKRNQSLWAGCLLILSLAYFQPSLAQTTETAVPGSWQVDFDAINTADNRSDSFDYDSLSDEGKTNLSNAFEGRVFEFRGDQIVVMSYQVYGKTRSITGQWSLNSSANEITITAQNRQVIYDLQIDDDTMHLKPQQLEPTAVFKELILKRK